MQLFKDKQLRTEFEEFKESFDSFKKVTDTQISILEQENHQLKETIGSLKDTINGLRVDLTELTQQVAIPIVEETPCEIEFDSPDTVTENRTEFAGKPIALSLQKLYKTFNFDGYWFKMTSGPNTGKNFINIHQIIELSKLKEGSFESWEELHRKTKFTSSILQRICYNIINGAFDPFLKQYYTTKFTFKNNKLLIDGHETGLTQSEVKEIIETYVNNTSETCLVKLCSLYPNINPDYIICICDNYFRITVTAQSKEIEFENNPQKRKEKGMI